ncbi:MAG: ADYC domain-containing protein [Myxococcota bacterium]
MSTSRIASLLLASLLPLGLGACDEVETSETEFSELAGEEITHRCPSCGWGPPILNTHGLNGLAVSELDTMGEFHDGWRMIEVSVRVDGNSLLPLESVWVENGLLHGVDVQGGFHHGSGFLHSMWTLSFDADPGSEMHFMSVTGFTEGPGGRNRYTFQHGDAPDNIEAYNCQRDDETGEYSALLFENLSVDAGSGTHEVRDDTIYFACTSGAVGKAGMWGYSPSEVGEEVHQTATRAVRADYCGEGTSWTTTGTPLQVSDPWFINHFQPGGQPTEAMWGPEGAECLMVPRRPEYDFEMVQCGNNRVIPMCSDSDTLADWGGAYLWTKIW